MSTEEVLTRYDAWLLPDGPVAVFVREPLEAVQGPEGVVFPPTFAPPVKGEAPGYVIDETSNGKMALLDTVGSQANRLEPLFKEAPWANLVPRAVVKIGARVVNILDAGHRAADAVVRFSTKKADLAEAFRRIYETGDATRLAKLAPTSLLFGVWDSRGTGVKIPRLIGSTVRAYGVEPLTRAAQFFSAFEKDETEALGFSQDFLSEQGFSDAPAGRTVGGVVVRGGILRETVLNLVALRALCGEGLENSQKLRRYVVGLALGVLVAPVSFYLREGCMLVAAAGKPRTQEVVFRSGKREPFALETAAAEEYARSAAEKFGVGESWEAEFQKESVSTAADASKAKSAGKAKKKAG